MRSRRHRNSRQLLLIRLVSSVAIILIVTIITLISLNAYEKLTQTKYVKPATITKITKSELSAGLPMQLKIPIINVDTSIYYVGLKSDGTMDIKPDPTVVAWYEFGPKPGEVGSAVIAGHYGWSADGSASVFNNLHLLNKGDEILVINSKNVTITFVVRESREYDPDADAENVFKSNDGKSHLNLITCEGIWENAKNTYSNRLVIFADKK